MNTVENASGVKFIGHESQNAFSRPSFYSTELITTNSCICKSFNGNNYLSKHKTNKQQQQQQHDELHKLQAKNEEQQSERIFECELWKHSLNAVEIMKTKLD